VAHCMTLVRDADACVAPATALTHDECLIGALRRGDEAAFALLLERYHATMIRLRTKRRSSRPSLRSGSESAGRPGAAP
jgi:hypothetical protein